MCPTRSLVYVCVLFSWAQLKPLWNASSKHTHSLKRRSALQFWWVLLSTFLHSQCVLEPRVGWQDRVRPGCFQLRYFQSLVHWHWQEAVGQYTFDSSPNAGTDGVGGGWVKQGVGGGEKPQCLPRTGFQPHNGESMFKHGSHMWPNLTLWWKMPEHLKLLPQSPPHHLTFTSPDPIWGLILQFLFCHAHGCSMAPFLVFAGIYWQKH